MLIFLCCLLSFVILVKTDSHENDGKERYAFSRRCSSDGDITTVFIADVDPSSDYFVECWIADMVDGKHVTHCAHSDESKSVKQKPYQDQKFADLHWEQITDSFIDIRFSDKLISNLHIKQDHLGQHGCMCTKMTFNQTNEDAFEINSCFLTECNITLSDGDKTTDCSAHFPMCPESCSLMNIVIIEDDDNTKKKIEVVPCTPSTCDMEEHDDGEWTILLAKLVIILPVVFGGLLILGVVVIAVLSIYKIRRKRRQLHTSELKSNGFSSTAGSNPYSEVESVRKSIGDHSVQYEEVRDNTKSDVPKGNRISEIEMFDNHYYESAGLGKDTTANHVYEQPGIVKSDNGAANYMYTVASNTDLSNGISTKLTKTAKNVPDPTVKVQRDNLGTAGIWNNHVVDTGDYDSEVEMIDNDVYDSGPLS